MGDTMLGDGTCRRCRGGHQHVCDNRQEVWVRGGGSGSLAEQSVVPASSLHALPDPVDEVHLTGRADGSLEFARSLGFEHAWTGEDLPDLPFDAVIDASDAPQLPARALEPVEPAGRVVYVGLAGSPSRIDTRVLALKDVTAVGVLSASPGLGTTIEAYASGAVDPRPLVAATIGLDQVGAVLAGERPEGAGPGPMIHVDRTLS
jgi:threonine dehydrogenase-like Zn-dependent dehydrogenase